MRTNAVVEMVGRFAVRPVLLLICACALARASAAQAVKAPEDLHPPGTMFFLSVKNPQGSAALRDSALHKIASEPEMKAFIAHVQDTCRSLLEAYGDEIPVDLELAAEVLGHEFSVAFTGMRFTEDEMPVPGIMISCVFDRERKEFEAALERTLAGAFGPQMLESRVVQEHRGAQIKAMGPPNNALYYTFVGRRMIAASQPADLRTALDLATGEGEPLSAQATFKHVIGKVGGRDRMLAVYADVKGLLGQFGMFMPPEAQPMLEALGVQNIVAAGFGSRFADGGIRDAFYFYAPGERGGFLTPAPQPVDLAVLSIVPKNAEVAAVWRLDLEQAYGAVINLLQNIGDAESAEVLDAIADFEQLAGLRIKEDLLASLGTQMLFYASPDENVLMIEYKDRDALDSSIRKLIGLAGEHVRLGRIQYGGRTIHHLDITSFPVPISPSYTYGNKFIAFALYPQTLKGFLRRMRGGGGESIRYNPDFQRVAARYLEGCDGLSYSDAGRGLVEFYNLLVIGAHALHGVDQVPIRAELMPPASVVEEHMFGLGGGRMNDAEGILYESFSPVGSLGGTLSAIGQLVGTYAGGGMMNAQMTMVMAGMLMPALARARGEARGAACMGNLHNIGLGMAMYKIDHGGAMPETLDELYPVYLETVQTFLCPGDKRPMTIGGGISSSYHFVGAVPGAIRRADTIVAYDKAGNHPGRRNCLFADGHVERVDDWELGEMLLMNLEELSDMEGWEKLSEERREELEAFYSGAPAATGEMERIDHALP